MSREIKFRAWDRTEKRMVTDMNSEGLILIPTSPGWGVAQSNEVKGINEWDDYLFSWTDADIIDGRWEPLQFTGLKDKHGNEIWEGDILKTHRFTQVLGYGLGVSEGEEVDICFVKYNNEEAGFVFIPVKKLEEINFFNTYDFSDEGMEVIGNIYSNPELVEST